MDTESNVTPRRTLRLTPSDTVPRLMRGPSVTDTPVSVSGEGSATEAGHAMKKKEFIDRVVARCGAKKREARPAIEAALSELADLLAAGRDLQLPPVGKLKSVKCRDLEDGAQLLTIKLRTMGNRPGLHGDKTGVAGSDEDG